MNVWEAIQKKRAVRQFTDQPLPEDAVTRILQAGRRSQSSKNTQPWHFVVVRDPARLQELSSYGTYLSWLPHVGMMVAIVTENVEADHASWIAFDVGQSAAYMQLEAQELGVGSVVGRFHRWQEVGVVLGFPANMRCDVLIGFGYPAQEALERPRNPQGRRPLDEIVHWEKW
jgi:nitroreductase